MVSFYLLFFKISFVSGFVSIPYLYYMKGITHSDRVSARPCNGSQAADRDSALQKNKKNFVVYFLTNSDLEEASASGCDLEEAEVEEGDREAASTFGSDRGAAAAEGGDSRGSAVGDCEAASSFGGDREVAEGGDFIYIESFFSISECLFFIEKIKRKKYIYWISVT